MAGRRPAIAVTLTDPEQFSSIGDIAFVSQSGAMITAIDVRTHAVIRSYPPSAPSVPTALSPSVLTTAAAKLKFDSCPLVTRA